MDELPRDDSLLEHRRDVLDALCSDELLARWLARARPAALFSHDERAHSLRALVIYEGLSVSLAGQRISQP